jgi:miniconductance mechanosensitive channel
MKEFLENSLLKLLQNLGLNFENAFRVRTGIFIIGILILCWIINLIAKKTIHVIIVKLVERSKNNYDDIFLEQKVFTRLSHLIPAILLSYIIDIFFPEQIELLAFLHNAIYIYATFVILWFLVSLINALVLVYETFPISKQVPVKGYAQFVKIIVYAVCIIFIFSFVVGKSPSNVFTALGAAAAILLFVFKDTILGFVASIQLTANKLIKPGDTISMSKYNAEGVVLDINITSVKIRNANHSVTSIPTYSLVSDAFTNYNALEVVPGRHLKRILQFDFESLTLINEHIIKNLEQKAILKEFWKEIGKTAAYEMVNLTLFRKYVEYYLEKHQQINQETDIVVKQLVAADKGLPVEISAFCTEMNAKEFEMIQSEIMEHLFAMLPAFGLKMFQSATV